MPDSETQIGTAKAERLLSLLKPEQRDLVAARRNYCKPCSQNEKLSIVSVNCKACGCAGISLIHGRCKLRKWPQPATTSDGSTFTMPAPPMSDRNIFASIGENCLTDAVLARHGMKSIATPYSHARSNLDYVLQLEGRNYSMLLDPEYLVYEKAGDLTVVRNRHDLTSDPIYQELHRNGFEFTHHDVLSNAKHRESYLRKIARMQENKGKNNYIFFYHYRLCEQQDIQRLVGKLIELQKFYAIDDKSCEINVFTQMIVPSKGQRGLHITEPAPNIRVFVLRTLKVWAGDHNLVFAISDDDLLKEMLGIVRRNASRLNGTFAE